ncbi:DMT family transporter [Methylophilus sp. QUAN]|uniref:DMT family transporter n=1 Tax=Methylophilus sp. QUAN TaxID=2781020 RepID=UPI001E590717|nr:DMT family transporter [Methylophilus sp. QUAN]
MKGIAFPLLAIMMWSGNVLVSKLAAGLIQPLAMTFCRLLVALAVMATFILPSIWRDRAVIIQVLPKLAVLGFLSMALYQCLSYQAASTTTANHMAVMTALNPLLTMLVSACLLGEVLTLGMVMGGLTALLGIIVLVAHGNLMSLVQEGAPEGDVLMLVASGVYAFYSVLIRKWSLPLTVWQSTFMQAVSACICICMGFALLFTRPAISITSQTLPLILYAGVLASVLLPYFWIKGVLLIGPARCSLFMNVLPVLTAILSSVWLQAPVDAYFVAGTSLALGGVMLAQVLQRPLRQR